MISDLVEVSKAEHQDLAAEAVLQRRSATAWLCCAGTKVQMAEGQQQDDGAPVAFKLPRFQPPPSHCAPLHWPPALLIRPGEGNKIDPLLLSYILEYCPVTLIHF